MRMHLCQYCIYCYYKYLHNFFNLIIDAKNVNKDHNFINPLWIPIICVACTFPKGSRSFIILYNIALTEICITLNTNNKIYIIFLQINRQIKKYIQQIRILVLYIMYYDYSSRNVNEMYETLYEAEMLSLRLINRPQNLSFESRTE